MAESGCKPSAKGSLRSLPLVVVKAVSVVVAGSAEKVSSGPRSEVAELYVAAEASEDSQPPVRVPVSVSNESEGFSLLPEGSPDE
jgi:hypothetical protein